MQNNTNRIFIKNVNVRCLLIAACHSCLKNRLNVGYFPFSKRPPSGLWVTTHAWLNDRFLLPESQQKNLAELKRSFLDPALKQINEKTPLLAKYSIDDSGKFLFSIIDKQNPV
ncbi:TPA: replication initiation protein [Klebsiella quasipneumoniae]|uniref:replication initiation protein n=1 Tax=Klebsiella pneumoniae complex TaxID=3390273 RepID=UPI001D0E64A9|nr:MULTISPECIES: replication initiation protein [Klebsiella]MCQ0464821.1 replication initiation protein [Klebsiella pneumoniae]